MIARSDLADDQLLAGFDAGADRLIFEGRRGGAEIGAMRRDEEEPYNQPECGAKDEHLEPLERRRIVPFVNKASAPELNDAATIR